MVTDPFLKIMIEYVLEEDFGMCHATAGEVADTVLDLIQSNPQYIQEVLNLF
jgi:hypothetical protein